MASIFTGTTSGDTFFSLDDPSADWIIDGDLGNDVLGGQQGNDQVSGSGGNDTLLGDAGADTLSGGSGNDSLEGGSGADTIIGGGEFDIVSYLASASAVSIDLQTGILTGGDAEGDSLDGVELIRGSDFSDSLTAAAGAAIEFRGEAGDDTLTGGDENDTLEGGDGADSLVGGAGIDRASYSASNAAVSINLVIEGAPTISGGHADGDVFSGIEAIEGSGFNDFIAAISSNISVLIGGEGNDTLVAAPPFANEEPPPPGGVRFDGGNGDDEMLGDGGADLMNGGAGNDYIHASAGADSYEGGAGIDVLSYANATSLVNLDLAASNFGGFAAGQSILDFEVIGGSAFGDFLVGYANRATSLVGGGGDDNLWGGSLNDELKGEAGTDTIDGLGGNDTLHGGEGADSLQGDVGVDVATYADSGAGVTVSLITGAGLGGDAEGDTLGGVEIVAGSTFNDSLVAGATGAFLIGNGGADTIIGGAQADELRGDGPAGVDGNDSISGGGGTDTIIGGAGNDTLVGGAGDYDYLVGGAGADKFEFATGFGKDVVADFAVAEDIIRLATNIDGASVTTAAQALALAVAVNGGADTAIILDGQAFAGSAKYVLLVGVTLANLTTANFEIF